MVHPGQSMDGVREARRRTSSWPSVGQVGADVVVPYRIRVTHDTFSSTLTRARVASRGPASWYKPCAQVMGYEALVRDDALARISHGKIASYSDELLFRTVTAMLAPTAML